MRISAMVGARGEGKTTAAAALAARAASAGLKVAGIVAPVVYQGGRRMGYDVIDLGSGARASWLRETEHPHVIGPFGLVSRGADLARRALERMLSDRSDLAILDEVGEWELAGGGHAWAIRRLGESPACRIVVVMREGIVSRVTQRWGFTFETWRPGDLESLASQLGMEGDG